MLVLKMLTKLWRVSIKTWNSTFNSKKDTLERLSKRLNKMNYHTFAVKKMYETDYVRD